ncbi:unnamed protein product [Lampetra fluviatilis]
MPGIVLHEPSPEADLDTAATDIFLWGVTWEVCFRQSRTRCPRQRVVQDTREESGRASGEGRREAGARGYEARVVSFGACSQMSDAMSAAAATTQRGGKGASGATLDFSFRCITAMEDLLTEDPRSVPAEAKARNANAVKAPSQHKTEDAIMAGSGTTSMRVAEVGSLGYASVAPSTDTAQSEHKYDVTALRLNNNALTNLEGFWETTAALIQQPSALAWIDLSFNQLSDIPQVLCELQELRVLYLHGNTVSRLSNVSTLVPLRHLRSLTLHGNPIETENHYRYYVLSALPSLKSLDFSAVTNQDRQTAVIWSMNRARHSKLKL